jgi:hypothetical protein
MKHPNTKVPIAGTTALPVRTDKTLHWLAESRDSWKKKTQESKTKLKTTTLALNRAKEERDKRMAKLKKKQVETQKQLDQKDNEIVMLKRQLEQANKEVENLKKKK